MSSAEPGRDDSYAANRSLWDAWTAVHATGTFYDLEGFRAGGIRLRDDEVEAVGDVMGQRLLHLQCHFGIDTLSWARLGALVTGADFSPAAVALARELALDLGFPEARFVESNLYELPANLQGEFDVVYTSRGVLGWLPDIAGWARVVAHFLAPGGRFYISEVHPIAQVFENEGVKPGELRLAYPYWEHRDPLVFDVKGSYADPAADVGEQTEHGWNHGLGEIVTALILAGLRLEWLRESPELDWATDFLVESEPGSDRFRLPAGAGGELPLMFSLLATKPSG
ncbi:MAG TPA: class I SAM-dependent methyltransferase [Candidatus Saccharimonadales bacterium]|nr:class I SAM-dependent methyltransferase [Candidatus Saccharimonadales bacterium]